ncbi:MAG: leucyl/phenylalanyl-tRNA--protein transferase [Chitinophagaceae bacterium]|nr:leucyl/phenylalanyl-tRNA--protein transferase [Chitinophagaceae bacterium]
MSLQVLTDKLWFPPVEQSAADGLLAIGGDLSTERLLLAYRSGIFPWYNDDEPPLWWSPDPRFVIFPEELYVSKSMQQLFTRRSFKITMNKAFTEVIRNCGRQKRRGQNGTWITAEIEDAYTQLHKLGYAVSVEAWKDNNLVGGLYGIRMGKLFFGESMFAKVSNASKYAFIAFVQHLQKEGVVLIDCQVYTEHLESLGARMIDRNEFIELVKENL